MSAGRLVQPARPYAAAGFTILEMLVALIILAAGVAALTGTVSDSLDRQNRADQYAQATDLAENLLAELDAGGIVTPEQRAGKTRGIEWSMIVSPEPPQPGQTLKIDRVTLTLSWRTAGQKQIAVWRTLRPASGIQQIP